jgi:hypothetical protein
MAGKRIGDFALPNLALLTKLRQNPGHVDQFSH